MTVVVHNTDGVNPYAAELASALVRGSDDVTLVDTANAEHRPAAPVRWLRRLPENFGAAGPVRQVWHLVRGLAATLRRGSGGATVLVAFWRFPIEAVLLGLLAAAGRTVAVVEHNPVPREAEGRLRRLARRFLLARATVVIVHAERLVDAVDPVARRVEVCPHPPYSATAPAGPAAPTTGTTGTSATTGSGVAADPRASEPARRWIAFVGALRWDKGADLLADLVERIPADAVDGLGLVVCGRGRLPDEAWARIRATGIAVRDLTADAPVPQQQFLDVLADRPTVLAPYVAATQSGTVVLALTMGCRVLAFDEGGIPDVVADDGLVPSGDLHAMAQAIAADRGGDSRMPIADWDQLTTHRWAATLARAATTAQRDAAVRRSTGVARLRARGGRLAARSSLIGRVLVQLDRRSGAGRGTTWDTAADRLVAGAPDAVGVDLFDTVVTRRILGDDAVFAVVGADLRRRGHWPGDVAAFVAARRRAADLAPRAPVDELYRTPPLAELPDDAWRVEVEVERQVLTAVPGAKEGLQRLRDAGTDITFVTDMHLPRATLQDALRRHGLTAGGDRLVVSSEVDAAKSDGSLFVHLRAQDGPAVHVGNDLWSDVAMAERHGVAAVPLASAEPTRLERIMARATDGAGPAIAAAALQTRCAAGRADADVRALTETGADVAGQCFTGFLLWAREVCEQERIDRTLFLARDGELLLRMARALPDDHWEGVELDYFELASRRAWTVAAAASLGIDEWLAVGTADDRAFVHTSRHLVPFGSLLRRLALTRQDVTGLSGHERLARLGPDDRLPIELVDDWEAFVADPRVHERILAQAHDARGRLLEHLDGLDLGGGRLALIDVGWRGQLAWMMSAVLRETTGHDPLHLHVGGANVAPGLDGKVDIRRFAVDDRVAPLPFPDMVSCVETFTASGRARALDLERGPDGAVRVVTEAAVPAVRNAARERVWAAAEATAARLPSRAELDRWGLGTAGLAAAAREVLTAFWTTPEPAHAAAAGHLGFEVDDAGTVVGPVASPYRPTELLGGRPVAPRQWRQGSLVLTPAPLRVTAAAALQVKDRVRPGRP